MWEMVTPELQAWMKVKLCLRLSRAMKMPTWPGVFLLTRPPKMMMSPFCSLS